MGMNLSDSLKTLSHHAHALIGGESVRTELISILEKKHKIKKQGNPDFFDRTYLTFSIDDSREVKAFAETRPVDESGKKIFVLLMTGITVEAQNALLKVLEEPPSYAHFFLILPSAHLLLPTVKSRLSVIGSGSAGGGDVGKNTYIKYDISSAKELLALPTTAKKLDYVKSFMEEITKEKRPKQDAIDFLNALQEVVYSKGVKDGAGGNIAKLQAIETARTYMNDRAPSLKMLLEYVALNV